MEELKKMAAAQENIRIEGFGIKEARELKRLMQIGRASCRERV